MFLAVNEINVLVRCVHCKSFWSSDGPSKGQCMQGPVYGLILFIYSNLHDTTVNEKNDILTQHLYKNSNSSVLSTLLIWSGCFSNKHMSYTHWCGGVESNHNITIACRLVVLYIIPVCISKPSQMKSLSSQFDKCLPNLTQLTKAFLPVIIFVF